MYLFAPLSTMNCEILEKLLELGKQYDAALELAQVKYRIEGEHACAAAQAERVTKAVKRNLLRASALAKLTEAERLALGWANS
jgi:hypothetical protein